jgi:hypothetical protein
VLRVDRALAARADTVAVSATLTLNFLDGKHDTGTSLDRLIFVQGPPPLTFGYGSTSGGRQQTQLSVINITLRESFAADGFIGVGQTIYNQRTSYPPMEPDSVLMQASRVTGARLEVGLARRLFGTTNVEYVFASTPACAASRNRRWKP